jgi:hypothetical protein
MPLAIAPVPFAEQAQAAAFVTLLHFAGIATVQSEQ